MIKTLWLGLLATLLLSSTAAAAESKLFSDEAPLQITITAPFPALVSAAKTSMGNYPATFTVTDGAGPAQSFAIQLHARGLTRRTAGYCNFPPLSVNFDKIAVHGTLFKGQHKLKLVTYCRTGADYEQRIILEYLAYKIYNLMTPMSFRVRAAQVTYRSSERDAGVTRFGFLVEDIDDVAARNDREKLTATSHQVPISRVDAHAAARVTLFEYMLGNLDWELLAAPAGADCCHNSRFIAAPGATPATATAVVPVPYDFDYSGLVDSPYSGPPESIHIERLTDRFYRGYCATTAEIPSVIEEYRAKRAAIMAVVANEPRLTSSFRTKASHFLDGFFATLDDQGRVQTQIVKHCR